MTMYSRDAADRLLFVARRAAETVKIESAHLAELAETIITLHDRVPAPPQIIRTSDELDALDPDTLVIPGTALTYSWQTFHLKPTYRAAAIDRLDLALAGPLVVIATGDQVRAARQALTEAAK